MFKSNGLSANQKDRQMNNRMDTKRRTGVGMSWETGIDAYTLLILRIK